MIYPCGKFAWQEFLLGQTQLPPALALFALELSRYADVDGGSVRPGAQVLAERRGLSERQVRRHLEALDQLGLIQLVARGGGRGRRTANEYQLTVPPHFDERLQSWLANRVTRRCPLNGVDSPDTVVSVVSVNSPDTDSPIHRTPRTNSPDTLRVTPPVTTPAIDQSSSSATYATDGRTREPAAADVIKPWDRKLAELAARRTADERQAVAQ